MRLNTGLKVPGGSSREVLGRYSLTGSLPSMTAFTSSHCCSTVFYELTSMDYEQFTNQFRSTFHIEKKKKK